MEKIYFTKLQKNILKRRKNLDISTIAGNSERLNIEREFRDSFFRYEQQISLKELNEKIKKEYPTFQDQKQNDTHN